LTLARDPTPIGPSSSRVTLATPEFQPGHADTSVHTVQTRTAGASISMTSSSVIPALSLGDRSP
jgi:hypothetical protein